MSEKAKSPHKLVLVEDNPADTLLLRYALNAQEEPYTLEVHTDGEAALRFLREHCGGVEPEPCLFILDLHLPRYDGVTILREIRTSALAHVRVAILTNLASPGEKNEVHNLGADLYRIKPCDWDDVLTLARELIDLCNRPIQARTTAVG